MNQGSYVLSQVFDLINRYEFDKCVNNHNGNYRVKVFTCWEQFIVMSFAQLSYRESLRDIEFCLGGMRSKLYHCGLKAKIARNTLAKANENRSWEIYADLAKILISKTVPLYKIKEKTTWQKNLKQLCTLLIVQLLICVRPCFPGQSSGQLPML